MLAKKILIVTLVGVGWLARPNAASGCSIALTTPHTLDPAEQAVDRQPPDAPAVAGFVVTRGVGPRQIGCCGSATSCDDIAVVRVRLLAPADDRTGPTEMGYRVTLVAGALPAGASLPANAIRAGANGGIGIFWIDGATDQQEPVDFTLGIVAVDLAGNESTPPTEVQVTDPGSAGGCRAGTAGPIVPVWVAAGIGVLALRFRRRWLSTR